MKFASLFLSAASLITHSALAHPVERQDAELESRSLEERQATTVAITGVPGATYPRLEIRQMLFNKPNQWTLFILAMQKFHAMSQTDQMSYYQIAGIHGVPRQNWDNVGQCSTCSGTDGYCTHDSVLFPSWHRVYMALFEQQFMVVVNQIANSYPAAQKPAMTGAASTMRFPYWDWAAHPKPGYPTLPTVVTQTQVTVNGPSGSVTINNPLYRHYFDSPKDLVYSPFVDWSYTLRYPNSNAASGSSVEQSAITAFDNIRASMQDQVYQLFSTCKDYLHFSNDQAGSSSTSCSNSLEGIHNTIHTNAGGPGSSTVSAGHMTYLATAAFDPIFWLHHCNVDRLFAMWQAINPSSYGASQPAPANTWTIAKGSTQNAASPLAPFHKDTSGTFWTTNDVKNTNVFHYTYPEFSNSDGSSAAINSYINKLYGPSATATAGSSKRTAGPEPVREVLAERTAAPEAFPYAEFEKRDTPLKAGNGSLYQYVANIQTPRYSLNGSYNVYLFNGNPTNEDPLLWQADSNLIGPVGIMAQPGMTGDILASGSVPLTRTLQAEVAAGTISDMSEDTVVPYLTSQLVWRIAGPKGTSVDPNSVKNFEVAVYGSTASVPPSPDVLPKYSDFIELADVTHGKAGGLARR